MTIKYILYIYIYIGQYTWRRMSFGLTNVPSTFQLVMNDLFCDFLKKKVLVYLDVILVYSTSKEQHLQDDREVLQLLKSIKYIIFCFYSNKFFRI